MIAGKLAAQLVCAAQARRVTAPGFLRRDLGRSLFCAKLKGSLQQRAVSFVERNIAEDATALEDLQKLGWMTTPVTVVNGQIVVGFDAERLDELLA